MRTLWEFPARDDLVWDYYGKLPILCPLPAGHGAGLGMVWEGWGCMGRLCEDLVACGRPVLDVKLSQKEEHGCPDLS